MALRSPSLPSWMFDANAISAEEDEDYRSEISPETSCNLNLKHLAKNQAKFTNWNDLSTRLKRGIQSGNEMNNLFSQDIVGADVVLCVDNNYENGYSCTRDEKKKLAVLASDESHQIVRFFAHRFILAASSGPFRAMLTGKMREATQREVVLHGVSPAIVQKMLVYVYTGEVEIDLGNAVDTLIAAEMYEFNGLRDICKSFVLLHAHEVFRSSCIIHLPENLVIELIERDDLQIREAKLLEALVNWGRSRAASSDKPMVDLLSEIMEHVRFPTMSVSDLYGKVRPLVNEGYIRESLLTEALFYHLKWGTATGRSSKRMKQQIPFRRH
nr:conserved hypothetical protein [Albugo laibachii Nc14]|eukprot:CCA26333.1 conserved hypothetical protein [Albugo laibachii Nc14]